MIIDTNKYWYNIDMYYYSYNKNGRNHYNVYSLIVHS